MNGLEQPTCAPPAPPPACREVLPSTRLVRLRTAEVDLQLLLEAGGGRPPPTGQTELGLGQQPWRSTMGLNPWGLLREWPGQRNAWCSAEALHESLAQGLVRRALSARQDRALPWLCSTTGREGPDRRTDDTTDRHPTDSARPRAGHTPGSARGAYSLTPERSSSSLKAAAARGRPAAGDLHLASRRAR